MSTRFSLYLTRLKRPFREKTRPFRTASSPLPLALGLLCRRLGVPVDLLSLFLTPRGRAFSFFPLSARLKWSVIFRFSGFFLGRAWEREDEERGQGRRLAGNRGNGEATDRRSEFPRLQTPLIYFSGDATVFPLFHFYFHVRPRRTSQQEKENVSIRSVPCTCRFTSYQAPSQTRQSSLRGDLP